MGRSGRDLLFTPAGRGAALFLSLLLPISAAARTGSLAVINSGRRGSEAVARVCTALQPRVGGRARQPGVSALLVGKAPHGPLPAGDTGRRLIQLLDLLRTRGSGSGDLAELGRLLMVDYLLLVRISAGRLTARLFSSHLQRFAARDYAGPAAEVEALERYVVDQTGGRGSREAEGTRWWLWAAAAVLAGVSVALAVSANDEGVGDLRIRVSR